LPKRLLILGGGPVGCELAQSFVRLGAAVTLVEQSARLLEREDAEFSAMLMDRFHDEGVAVRVSHSAAEFQPSDATGGRLICEHAGARTVIEFDRVLLALGRRAATTGYGLETLGVTRTKHGTLEV